MAILNMAKIQKVATAHTSISVTTSSRLHMGFFDLNGDLGRCFGSIGLALNAPNTVLTVTLAKEVSASGDGADRAIKIAQLLSKALNLDAGLHIQINQTIPEHSGLGSGTQLSLAIGMALSQLYGLNLSVNEIAVLTKRGARSGVGLGSFAQGGLIVDGGRAVKSDFPPVIAHADFPDDWPILLIFDRSHQGVHGEQEIAAFQNLPPFPAEASAVLCRHVLMQALPAIAERDLKAFGAAIQALQTLTGDYFAPAQGGARYTSPLVAAALQQLQSDGVHCFGQSSWGPTGFAVFDDKAQATQHLHQLKTRFDDVSHLEFMLTNANNQPSLIEINA